MNREILFRGKRTDNGEWVEGDLLHNHDGRTFCGEVVVNDYTGLACDKYEVGIGFCEVKQETVSQYTGLTDKNGVKIFEGDIIETQTQDTKQLRNAEVRFGEFADINSDEDECYIGFYIVFDGIFTTAGQLKECSNSIEVIGNIFDHPDLLEENNT